MTSKNKVKLIIFLSSFLFLFFININISFALNLQVDIPGQEALDFNGTTKPIGQYIKNIYNYAISIVGIVATIMLMFGGFTWLTAGGSGEKVGKARDIIFGALTGLVLALTSYTILTLVNPDLVNFKVVKLQKPNNPPSSYSDTNGCCLVQTDTSLDSGIFDECAISAKDDCDPPLVHTWRLGNKCENVNASSVGKKCVSTAAYEEKLVNELINVAP